MELCSWPIILLLISTYIQISQATKCIYSVQKCKRDNYCTDVSGSFTQLDRIKESARDFFMCIKTTARGRRRNGESFVMKVRLGISEKEYYEEFERKSSNSNIFAMFGKKNKFAHDKKCTPFPYNVAPRKVRDQVRRHSDDGTITHMDACGCKKNYCNDARQILQTNHQFTILLLATGVLLQLFMF